MKTVNPVRVLFAIAAAYDGLLGLAFLFAGPQIFGWCGVTPPNHWGYVQFPAGLLVTFGLMFLAVARQPLDNRNLIPYGILLKVCFVGTVGWYWLSGGVPAMWKPFAVIDSVFALLFVWAWVRTKAALAAGPAVTVAV